MKQILLIVLVVALVAAVSSRPAHAQLQVCATLPPPPLGKTHRPTLYPRNSELS